MAELPSHSRSERLALLADARLYLCTGARREQGDLAAFLDSVLAAGVDVVQLREKGMEAGQELELCRVVAAAAERHGRLWSVNDRADVALGARPDILHLGQGDLPVSLARDVLGADVLLGLSSHSPAEVDAAAVASGVDYFCVGPTWATPTKPGRPAAGLALLDHAVRRWPPDDPATRPWFAIGGIDLTTIDEVLAHGARRVVVVRAITEAADPAAATRDLAARLRDRP
ncbi:MAG TPA: thiamine phosphate synthase [Mycobacteriales bacterium]|nr:thiamine phosphate synthase [Mycobacteriales bacterium]